jgi:hypothetical protein
MQRFIGRRRYTYRLGIGRRRIDSPPADSAFYAVDDLRTVSIAVQLSDGSIRLAEYAREDLPLVKPAEKTRESFNVTLPAQADPNIVWLPPH